MENVQKNAFRLLGTLLAVFGLALSLRPSVAQLRSAASVTTHAQTTADIVSARVLYGPRRHTVRASLPKIVAQQPMTIAIPSATSSASSSSTPSTAITTDKSHLKKILDASGADEQKYLIAEKVLALIEPSCLEKLQTFSVLYNHPKHRGLAGNGAILLSGTVPDDEFIGLLMHEALGHFRDLTCLTGHPTSGASAFHDGPEEIYNDDPSVSFYGISWNAERQLKTDAAPADFVTGYAHDGDTFEDLAESITYYMTQEKAFRTRAETNTVLARKLAWIEKYLPKERTVAEGQSWDGNIAWDATKLGFTWIAD